MEQQPPPSDYSDLPPAQGHLPLPNATATLVLGIISIVGCICYGIPGLACGIIALVMARTSKRLYIEKPGVYSSHSFGHLKAGQICAIIGTSLSAIYMIIIIVYIVFLGHLLKGAGGFMPFFEKFQ